jgi:beta-galactosidase
VEYWLDLSFTLAHDERWAAQGHEVAWEQFRLPAQAPRAEPARAAEPLSIVDVEAVARFSGRDWGMTIDRVTGTIGSYSYKGRTLIERGPRPHFWRAATDNDIGGWKGLSWSAPSMIPAFDATSWRGASQAWSVKGVQVTRLDASRARAVVSAVLPGVGAEVTMTYDIDGSGDVVVETSYTPPARRELPFLPRFGTELVVGAGLEQLQWYGRGPRETHVDRRFERIGVHASSVDAEWVEYSQPQENGNKADVRWVALTDDRGVGLLAVGDTPLSVAARHHSTEEIDRAAYSWQLTRQPQVFLHLDAVQAGVGGIDSWSVHAYPRPPYRLDATQPRRFRYRLSPIDGAFLEKTREAFPGDRARGVTPPTAGR